MKQRQLFQKPMLLLFFLFATTLAFSQVTEQWVKRYNGPSTENDQATSVAVDGAGNVYVSGTTNADNNGSYNTDYTTIKYDAAGNKLWLKRYDSHGSDVVADMAIDSSGNVYITGSSNYGYATIKYDASGNELWVRRYQGGSATSLAVDASGNVYVTGGSYNSDFTTDYATIKYDAAGAELWIRKYNSPENLYDNATTLVVDASGNVYVTGTSYNGVIYNSDYTTIKYDAVGNELWVKQFQGSENSVNASNWLAVDASGNVYVSGCTGSYPYFDYVVVKYDAAGNQLWLKRYNGTGNGNDQAKSVAVDGAGNVYVTGTSANTDNGLDYATIKYDAAGNQLWVKRYNGPGAYADMVQPLVVDASGNVYITGTSGTYLNKIDYATVKYSASGAQLWVKRYNGTGNRQDVATSLAVDGTGNVYVTGGSYGGSTGDDYTTIKYSAAGNELWVNRDNGLGKGEDLASSLVVDASGNVYVTGVSYSGAGYNADYATIKYDAAGIELWVKRYNGPGNGTGNPESNYDLARSIAVDASGNVYVTGESVSTTGFDYATIKYDAAGNELWIKRYSNLGYSYKGATALAVDASGNVYITGGSGSDYTTIKYDAVGNELWVKRYNGPANTNDYASSLVVDASGNVYVTGVSEGDSSGFTTRTDYATIKYDAAGNELWVKRYNGPGNSFDRATSLALDASGSVYVTGSSPGSSTGDDYATIKYNAAGNELWVRRYNSPGNGYDIANSLAVDSSGNVYITGTSATIKYDAGGNELWTRTFISGNNLALDTLGNVYVTGQNYGFGAGDSYATIKYDAAGNEQWLKRYNGPGNSNDAATVVAVGGSGNVYVTGSSVGDGTSLDYATIKYAQTQTTRGVYSFTLFNADSNEELRELKDGDIINLTELGFPRLTMRAYTSPAVVGSVVLRLSGPLSRRQTENLLPYTLYGDDQKRNYYGVAFPAGNYTLTATPYSAAKGKGEKGKALTIYFTVIDTAANSLILVNTELKQDIRMEKKGDINLAALPNPFTGQTNITFSVPASGRTLLDVYNMKGEVVERLYDATTQAGKGYTMTFNSKQLPAGMYMVKLTSSKQVQSYKLVLIR